MSDTAEPVVSKTARYPDAKRQTVPPFARYEGTSAWRKDRKRVREYNRFRATTAQAAPATGRPSV